MCGTDNFRLKHYEITLRKYDKLGKILQVIIDVKIKIEKRVLSVVD